MSSFDNKKHACCMEVHWNWWTHHGHVPTHQGYTCSNDHSRVWFLKSFIDNTVEPLFEDHSQNQADVISNEGWFCGNVLKVSQKRGVIMWKRVKGFTQKRGDHVETCERFHKKEGWSCGNVWKVSQKEVIMWKRVKGFTKRGVWSRGNVWKVSQNEGWSCGNVWKVKKRGDHVETC